MNYRYCNILLNSDINLNSNNKTVCPCIIKDLTELGDGWILAYILRHFQEHLYIISM